MHTDSMLKNRQSWIARTLIARSRRDPLFFCEHVLGVRPWRKQAEILAALRDHDRVAVRSGHGTGKSFIAAVAALWFLYSFYPAKVVTTAPTQAQVRNILWNEIRARHAASAVPLGGALLEEAIKLAPGAFAVGLSTDAPERLQGYHAEHVLVILDEAPGVRPEIWEAAETLLTGRVARMLAIGNPTRPAGRFYRCFAPGSAWRRIHVSCLDSPNRNGKASGYGALVTDRWIEEKRREWGEDSPLFRARVLGEFPESASGTLLPRSALEEAAARAAPPLDEATLALGVDVARFGSDRTVLVLRDKGAIRSVEVFSGLSTMETAGHVIRAMRSSGVRPERVFIDDTGLGAGVTDRLREQNLPVAPVVLGAAAADRTHFANCRAECFWRLREAILEGFAIPGEEVLLGELGEIRTTLASSGALRIEAKDLLRGRTGASPDRADALALTFAQAGPAFEPEMTVI